MIRTRFGTDGWRGVIADEFTLENLRTVVQAVVSYVKAHAMTGELVVGHDTRFMSDVYARAAASVAAGNGLKTTICTTPVTTPMLSHAVWSAGGCGGIMVTASHNPYRYNGIKYKAGYGGSASPSIIKDIESCIGHDQVVSAPFGDAVRDGRVSAAEFYGPYSRDIYNTVDTGMLKLSAPRVMIDCMHGAAGGYAARLFQGAGVDAAVLRAGADPLFGGINPEPVDRNLAGLSSGVAGGGYDIGFAVDGDADRLAVVDGSGNFVSAHVILALLTIHMCNARGLHGAVVKTVSTSSIVDRVAARLGLPVIETPVGFKHICELMLRQDVLIGGEENGGVGIKGFIPERDGLLAALLVTEMVAATGKSIGELAAGLDVDYGRLYYNRRDIPIRTGGVEAYNKLKSGIRTVFGEFGIARVSEVDGIKAVFNDGSWILFRLSGTEPLIRVYSESEDQAFTDRLMEIAGEAILG